MIHQHKFIVIDDPVAFMEDIDLDPEEGYTISALLPQLSIGSIFCLNTDTFRNERFTHVLSISSRQMASIVPSLQGVSHNKVIMESHSLLKELIQIIRFAQEGLSGGNKLFVHCIGGVGRSPAIAIAILMFVKKFCFAHAYGLVKQRHAHSKPKQPLLQQLLAMEKLGISNDNNWEARLFSIGELPVVSVADFDIAADIERYSITIQEGALAEYNELLQCPACIKTKELSKIQSHAFEAVNPVWRYGLKRFATDYTGQMVNRAGDRVLNHLDRISKNQAIIASVMSHPELAESVARFFYHQITLDEAIKQFNAQGVPDVDSALASFLKRDLLEFHPNDSCNNSCEGCSYGFDRHHLNQSERRFPFKDLPKIIRTFSPKAVTIVGGGEPFFYRDNNHQLSDLLHFFSDQGIHVGAITNGTYWPQGDWYNSLQWIRVSLDSNTRQTYLKLKGYDRFENVMTHIRRLLEETPIASVGIGYVYRAENIAEAPALIQTLIDRFSANGLSRLNIQFRPWRSMTGLTSGEVSLLSTSQIETFAKTIVEMCGDKDFAYFVKNNTNASNVRFGGSKRTKYFEACYMGYARVLIRASGDLFPCAVKASSVADGFNMGNVISDEVSVLALKQLYVFSMSVRNGCLPGRDRCYASVVNHRIEEGILNQINVPTEYAGNYFF
jgi:MoaA/NifB/PqqE/SkfB family radical SAM enzyme